MRRLLQTIPVAVLTVTLVFFFIHLVPGDPVLIMLGEASSAADRAHVTHLLGLDQPLWTQYIRFWGHILSGSWGQSFTYERPVLDLIQEKFGPTLLLALSALCISLLVSIPLGLWAAKRRGLLVDKVSSTLSLSAASIPIFVLAPLAVLLLSVKIPLFHVSGFESFSDLVLPSLCLGVGISGYFTRIVRAGAIEVLQSEYILTARSKGLSETRIILTHVLKNVAVPLLSILGSALGGLLAGAVVTETLFDWPGIGRLMYGAFQSRDYPLVQGIVLWVSFSYLFISILIDTLFSSVDRRIRRE